MLKPYHLLQLSCTLGLLWVIAGCQNYTTKTETGLVKLVFDSIKENNQKEFRDLTITSADFMLEEYEIKPFERSSSYIGQVLKPEEQAAQQQQFEQAVAGGSGQIDFKSAKFLGTHLLDQGDLELLSGSSIHYKIYSLLLETNGKKIDSQNLSPQFVVTPWKNEFRLYRLKFHQ